MQSIKNSLNTPDKVEGWLLDLYPGRAGEMTIWIKCPDGTCVKLVDRWHPKTYISGREEDLRSLEPVLATSKSVVSYEFDQKYVRLQDIEKSPVIRVKVADRRRLAFFARKILRIGAHKRYQLFNVDIPSTQMYLYEKDLIPLGKVEAQLFEEHVHWKLKESVEDEMYDILPLNVVRLDIEVERKGRIPSLRDAVAKIVIKSAKQTFIVDSGSEKDKLIELVKRINRLDPDIMLTQGGDSFVFPYLARRALVNGVLNELALGREKIPLVATTKGGRTYFSYGRIYWRPPPQRLLGRIHVDELNSFIYADCGLEGLAEISRTCRMPLHRASRATIGTSMSSLQLYRALKNDILIPWKKREPENFKTAWDLLLADRGGFYFEPKVGIHDDVGEIDFASMYPTLMLTKNISPETVNCECCPNSPLRVPELEYRICVRRRGLIPQVLELILRKRSDYKRLRDGAADPEAKRKYDQRQAALKWILVTSFGYLGFKNARFGKVDAHIAVCAFARETLLNTAHIAEYMGFEVVHGIVDSLWLKKEGATAKDFFNLCWEVEEKTGLPINFEGQYRWIVFLPSKTHAGIPVLNRFFGVFKDRRLKVRGVELRRRDTPQLVRRCQQDMIKVLARAPNSEAFEERIPEALNSVRKYVEMLTSRKAAPEELLIEKQLSKSSDEYAHNVPQAIAARTLAKEGITLSAGQTVKYLILDADHRKPERRVLPAELVEPSTRYDAKEYLRLLLTSVANLLSPYGYTLSEVSEELSLTKQKTL